jgi:myosin heavy subunit
MGGDQIAIQSTVSDSGITIVRDGSMVGDCYVLFPDIACEKPAIESMKKRNNLTIDATRMKTEIEIERINARNSEKKQQQALAEATRLQAQNNHLSSQIESLKKSAEYPSADVESLRATIKARDAVIAGHQQTIGQQSAQIATLNATIKECDASAAGNQKTIEQLAAQVTVLKTIIKDRDATIAASKQKTTENLPGQIEALKITLSECNATIASSQKTIEILKAGVADSDRKAAAAAKELEATRKQPPKVVEKMVEKVVAPKIPDWLTGDYADAAISGITVGYRRSSPTKVIIRLPLKDWPAVSPTISKHLSDTWEDSRYKYTLLQQGAFSLSLPAAKGGIN